MPSILDNEDEDTSNQQQRQDQPEAESGCINVGAAAHAKELPSAGVCKMLLQSEE